VCGGWQAISCCIWQELPEDNRVANCTDTDCGNYRDEWGGIPIFDAISKDAEETEATTLQKKTKTDANQERDRGRSSILAL
jgi:hypothetical protein